MRAELEQGLRDPVIHAAYLLYAQARALDPETTEALVSFMCWLILFGRREMAHPPIIPNRLVGMLTTPDESGTHPMLRFAASMAPERTTATKIEKFYYQKIVPKFRLGRFLGERDLERLSQEPALSASLRGEKFRLLHDLVAHAPSSQLPSIAIVGFHRSVLGMGEDARRLFHCLSSAGIAAELVDVSPPTLEKSDEVDAYKLFESSKPSGEIIVFCMPPFEMMRTIAKLGLEASRRHQYRVGLWSWETTPLPDTWSLAYDAVDEIWAMSHFLEKAFEAQAKHVPVTYVPPGVPQPKAKVPEQLAHLFEGSFCFLSIFDFNSNIERKNPLGAIAAFKSAFPDEQDVRLILKTLNQDKHPDHFASIMDAIGEDERIVLIDGPLPQAELYGLLAAAGAFVSLHRSDGFGRPLVEAMLLGVPVVATQGFGSADYLDETTGYPISSVRRPVPRDSYPFAGGEWAEPDLTEACTALREVFQGGENVDSRRRRARERIERQYSIAAATRVIHDRLQEIAALMSGASAVAAASAYEPVLKSRWLTFAQRLLPGLARPDQGSPGA